MKETKKERRKKAMPKAFMSLIVAVAVTILIGIKNWWGITDISVLKQTSSWAVVGVYGGIFLFAFAVSMCIFYREKLLKYKLSKNTLFILLAVLMSSMVTWASKDSYDSISEVMVAWALGVGCVWALFTIFSKFDYKNIEKNFKDFFLSLVYKVIIPSMFLCIVLIGKYDTDNTFLASAKEPLINAGAVFAMTSYKLVEVVYGLGKYEYSGLFILAVSVFLLFFWLYPFLKKAVTAQITSTLTGGSFTQFSQETK